MSKFVVPSRLAAGGCVALAAVGALVAGGGSATAAVTMAITSLNVHHVPALTAKQNITITGTAFSEDDISSVAINGCTAGTYVVTSATTLVFKTDNTCAKTSTGVVTITKTAGGTVTSTPSTAAQALAFVDLPSLAANDTTTFPVVTAGTVTQTAPATSASVSGGTSIRVTAGAVKFVNSTAYPLSATLDGVKLTNVVMPSGGNYFTATVPAMAADATPKLVVTSNGVSKTFTYAAASSSATVADSFEFTIAGVSISVSPAFGPLDGTNKLTVNGSGFTSSTTVTVGGVSCPVVSGSVKATQVTCTVAKASTPGPVTVATTTGSVTSVITAGSTYTFTN